MMNEDQKDTNASEDLGKNVRLYLEKRIQLFTISIAEQFSLIAAQSFQKIIGTMILSSGLLFLWLAVAFFLGDLFQNTALGFLIASIPLFLSGVVFANTSSKKLTERIQAELVSKVMDGLEESLRLSVKEKLDQEENSEKE